MSYRSMWANVPGSMYSMHFGADSDIRLFKDDAGIGLVVNRSVQGEGYLTTTQAAGVFSKGVRFINQKESKLFVHLGTQIGVVNRYLDFDKLIFSDQLDPVRGVVRSSDAATPTLNQRSYLDINVGILARYKMGRYANSVGMVGNHINQPNESLLGPISKLPIRYTLHYSGYFPLGSKSLSDPIIISPAFVADFQSRQRTLNFGAYFSKNIFYGGLWVRSKLDQADALILMVGFKQAAENLGIVFQIGYSYDATISKLRYSTTGSNEISLRMNFGKANIRTQLGKIQLKKERFKRRDCSSFKDPTQLKNPTFF